MSLHLDGLIAGLHQSFAIKNSESGRAGAQGINALPFDLNIRCVVDDVQAILFGEQVDFEIRFAAEQLDAGIGEGRRQHLHGRVVGQPEVDAGCQEHFRFPVRGLENVAGADLRVAERLGADGGSVEAHLTFRVVHGSGARHGAIRSGQTGHCEQSTGTAQYRFPSFHMISVPLFPS